MFEAVATPAKGGCPSEDLFADFVADQLDVSLRAELQTHFDDCERCTDTLGLMIGAFDDGTGGSLSGEVTGGDSPAISSVSGAFAGRYEIRECVGLGAGGTVYAAYDPELERIVALKVLRGGGETREDGSTRPEAKWTREAKTMAKVVHPNVVAVHDVGVADEHVFIATEFVEGGSLDDWFKESKRSWSEVVAVFVEAGRGLAAIHDCGLVHRDFKPHNVLVGRDGRPRVTDFGLARLLPGLDEFADQQTAEHVLASVELDETIATRTRTGMVVGTPAYMSPEQWRSQPADARSDQFSFCVALYQGLTGRRPFGGRTSLQLAERVANGEVAPFGNDPRVPRWLRRIVMRGLSVVPDDRFASMNAMLEALADGPHRARRRWTTAGLIAGFVSVAGLGYAVASLPDEETCEADTERFSGIWDPQVRAELTAQWTDTALTARVTGSLDEFVDAWSAVSLELCRVASTDGKSDERLHQLQRSCLNRQRDQFAAVVSVLPTLKTHQTLDVVDTLPSPADCSDGAALDRIEPKWTSPEARGLAAQMAGELAKTESLRAAGRFEDALALAEELVARADANGDPALRAEALTQLGLTQSSSKKGNEAAATLRDAVWAAEASGHVRMATNAWIEIVEVVGGLNEDFEEAERALERADAVAHRLGDEEQLIHVQSSRGLLLSMQGKYTEALDVQQRATARAMESLGPRDLQVARMQLNLAAVLSHLGRIDEALVHALEGVSIFETEVSPMHAELAECLNTVAVLQIQQQDYEAARATYKRALEIARANFPADSLLFASMYSNVAHIDLAEKKYDSAIAAYEKVLGLYRTGHGAVHPEVGLTLHNLAGAIDDSGDSSKAIELYREALEIRLATSGPAHPGTANTQHNLGLAMFSSGEVDAGIEMMEKARLVRERLKVDPFKQASTRFMLARAYSKRGEEAKAIEYAERAVQLLHSIAPRRSSIREHIEAWLVKHRAAQ